MFPPTIEKIIIKPQPPFDFQKTLQFIKSFPATQNEQIIGSPSLMKAMRIQGQTLAFHLENIGEQATPQLELSVYANNPLNNEILSAVEQRVRFFLSLDDDLTEFYELAQNDISFAQLVMPKLVGYRQVKFPSPFENAMWAILAQRQSINQARQMKQHIIQQYSQPIQVDGAEITAFPEVEDFQPYSIEFLAELIGNERKADYLGNVIQAFSTISDDFLKFAPYKDVKSWLLDIKGIGEWSALFVLARGLGRMEQALTADKQSRFNQTMLQVAQKVYGTMSFTDLQRQAHYYGKWQGYWAHFLKAYTEIH